MDIYATGYSTVLCHVSSIHHYRKPCFIKRLLQLSDQVGYTVVEKKSQSAFQSNFSCSITDFNLLNAPKELWQLGVLTMGMLSWPRPTGIVCMYPVPIIPWVHFPNNDLSLLSLWKEIVKVQRRVTDSLRLIQNGVFFLSMKECELRLYFNKIFFCVVLADMCTVYMLQAYK